MKTAVIYARYSSNNQTEQSIEGQVHVCEDFAKKNNIIIIDSYIDRAMSGTNDDRDAFQKMLKDSNNKKWDYVLVYKLDRFARNKYESAIHRKHLKDNGITLLSAMENIPETPEGVLLESLLEGMNEYFSKELAQKVNRGLHESRMKGHCIGTVSFGYSKNEDKTLSINGNEANILKRMFEDYASGKTILQISKDFEKENITNKGNKFTPEAIRYILHSERYTGILHINGKTYDKIYPQIISTDLFNKVQTKLDVNKYGCRKDNHEIFILKDKIYCGYCNRKMYPISAISSNGKPIRYYKCITTKSQNCNVGKIDKDFIEGIVKDFLSNQLIIEDNLNFITNKIYELYLKRTNKKLDINNLKKSLQNVKTSISNILLAIEKGIFTDTTKSRLEELETQKKELQEKLVIEESKQQFEITKKDIEDYFKKILKTVSTNTIDLSIKCIKIYENKIEIQLLNPIEQHLEELSTKKLSTETITTTRTYKSGKTKTTIKYYDVYLVV